MEISFILTSKNEGEWFKHTVDQLVFDFPEFAEVIVLDDGSTDGSTDFLQRSEDQRIRLIRRTGLGVAGARNTASLSAHGRNLIFIDAHMQFPSGWWHPLLQLLGDPSIGAAVPWITDVRQRKSKGYGERFQSADLTLEWLPKRASSPYLFPFFTGVVLLFAETYSLTLEV